MFIICTIGVKLAITLGSPEETNNGGRLVQFLDFFQVATLVVSFVTNLMSTSTIGLYVWYACIHISPTLVQIVT